jgi:hypothetical protein
VARASLIEAASEEDGVEEFAAGQARLTQRPSGETVIDSPSRRLIFFTEVNLLRSQRFAISRATS